MELRGIFNKEPNGCLCDTPNNAMCRYDSRGYLQNYQIIIIDGELCLFYKSQCIEDFKINYCPLCGKKLEG